MKRIVLSIGTAIALAAPAAAAADTRWVLPQAVGINGEQVNTSAGRHCGPTQFGDYTMVGTTTTRGVQGRWTYKLRITGDGALHRARHVRFSSYTRASIRRQVRSVFAQTRYRYLAQDGKAYLQGVWHGGEQQMLIAFNLRQGVCRP